MGGKKTNNTAGCGALIVFLFLCGIFVWFILSLSKLLMYLAVGVKKCGLILLFLLVAYLTYRIVFYLTNRKPLTYEQVVKLAKRRSREYFQTKYKFIKDPVTVDTQFKSSLNVTGKWYEVEEPLVSFPAYVAALLKGKQHEWVVAAIEKDGIVCSMWANKGSDNQSVAMNCDINDIISRCRQEGGYSILRFHNHPNPDPQHYTTLTASEQDKKSAASCAEIVCREGINWLDFVCAQGSFIQFFSKMSDSFEVKGGSKSDIIDRIGITPEMDYSLQKEYWRRGSKKQRAVFAMAALAAVLIMCVVVGMNEVGAFSAATDFSTGTEITEDLQNAEPEYPGNEMQGTGEFTSDEMFLYEGLSVNMQRISAKTFDLVGYSDAHQVLVVHIPRYSSYYCYYDFPAEKYEMFLHSEHPDDYFNYSIGGQYTTVIVPESEVE